MPFSGVILVLNQFCNLALLESASIKSFYKQKTLNAVGDEAKTLIKMTPKLQHIIGGNHSNAIDAMGVKAKNRLDHA